MVNVQKPRRRWVRGALIGSLALNLVFIGLMAGAAYRHAGGPGARAGGPGAGSHAATYVHALPREARREMFRGMRQGEGAMPSRENRRERRRALYDEVLAALRAEPFDRDAVAALVRRQGEIALAFQTTAEAAWLAQVAAMTPAERDAYADRVAEILRRGPRGRGKPARD